MNHHRGGPCHKQWDYCKRVKREYYTNQQCTVRANKKSTQKAVCTMGICSNACCVSPATQWRHIKICPHRTTAAHEAATVFLDAHDKKEEAKKRGKKRNLDEMKEQKQQDAPSNVPPAMPSLFGLPNLNIDYEQQAVNNIEEGHDSASPSNSPPNSPPTSPLTLPTITDIHAAVDIGTFQGDLYILRNSGELLEPPSKKKKGTTSIPPSIHDKLDYLFARWILLRDKSFSTGTEKELLEFIQYLCPWYKPPNGNTISQKWVSVLWKEVNASVTKVHTHFVYLQLQNVSFQYLCSQLNRSMSHSLCLPTSDTALSP